MEGRHFRPETITEWVLGIGVQKEKKELENGIGWWADESRPGTVKGGYWELG